MSEEKQDNPKFEFKSIPLGKSKELTLNTAVPAKIGEGVYGEWRMWFAEIENAKVTHGRKPKLKTEDGYTGTVIIFPADKLNEKLIKAANGSSNVKVKITKNAEETAKGLITNYEVEKISEGTPSESSITPTEMALLNESQEVSNEGYEITKDIFIKSSQEPQYKGKISLERATQLYELFKKL